MDDRLTLAASFGSRFVEGASGAPKMVICRRKNTTHAQNKHAVLEQAQLGATTSNLALRATSPHLGTTPTNPEYVVLPLYVGQNPPNDCPCVGYPCTHQVSIFNRLTTTCGKTTVVLARPTTKGCKCLLQSNC